MFQGFSPETADFLWGIRMNNNREWFMAHKQQYVDTLYEPMKELGKELFQPFLDRPGNLLKVSRIYRDARMHPPEPYKESLWICIRRDVDWWGEHPCLYLEVNPEGVDYGFFIWKPSTPFMDAFRQEITLHPRKFLKMLHGVEAAVGQSVTAECYKRPKISDNPDLQPYFAWKGMIGCTRHEDFGESVFSPDFADRVRDFFRELIPLYDYFYQF